MSAKGSTAPIDTSVKVPKSVLAAAAKADEIHKQAYQPDAPPPDPQSPPAPDPNTPPPTDNNAPPPDNSTPPPPDPNAEPPAPKTTDPEYVGSWKHRYDGMKGHFDRVSRENRLLADRLAQMEQTIATLQAPAPEPKAPVTPEQSLITDEDKATWGNEMLDVITRQAREAVRGELASKDNEIAELRRQVSGVTSYVAGNARENMISTLDEQMPKWREQNVDDKFKSWLSLPDAFSGAIRQSLLSQAWEQNNTPRVLAIFKGFLSEEAAVAPAAPAPVQPQTTGDKPALEDFAAPGRARTAATAQGASEPKPTITRDFITKFYVDVRRGVYAGKEQEKDRIEREIWAAQHEGRVR